jgi:DNA-binding NtrC family response regulator
VGQGTTVRVTLPLPADAAPAPRPAAPLVRQALRILLVDDEEDVRQALAEMLTSQGHTLVLAASGPDALRRIDEGGEFDLVVSDLVMPTMTGWELAEAVKRRRPALRIGVVTGWGDVPEVTPATRRAVDFVLSKPVTLEALDEAVRRLA